jgi:flagellar hook assembly protein FlgD
MEIFDMQGKLIRTLIHNSEMLPGNYQLFWDGLNARGEMVSDGTYLCLLNGKSLGKIIRKKP